MYLLTDAQARLIHLALSDTAAHYGTSRNTYVGDALAVVENLDHESEDEE